MFYRALNGLLYKSKHFKDEIVLFYLVNTVCKPYLLYGIEGIPLFNSYTRKIERKWHKVFWKIINFQRDNLHTLQFLRASAMLKHVIAIGLTSVRPSVRLSVRHTLAPYQNG